jgi:hypothetical protein
MPAPPLERENPNRIVPVPVLVAVNGIVVGVPVPSVDEMIFEVLTDVNLARYGVVDPVALQVIGACTV